MLPKRKALNVPLRPAYPGGLCDGYLRDVLHGARGDRGVERAGQAGRRPGRVAAPAAGHHLLLPRRDRALRPRPLHPAQAGAPPASVGSTCVDSMLHSCVVSLLSVSLGQSFVSVWACDAACTVAAAAEARQIEHRN